MFSFVADCKDGRPLNINEGDWEFVLEGQDSDEQA
jgi:hypothetical protein